MIWKAVTHILMGICIAIMISVIVSPTNNLVIMFADWVSR